MTMFDENGKRIVPKPQDLPKKKKEEPKSKKNDGTRIK